MARGVTEADVARACDALLVAGERPTVERVRQHLGTGSPNTVGPHLDAWFKGLGARIVNPGGLASQVLVPDAVQEAAKFLWDRAVAEARKDFDERLQAGMADAVANVEAEKERGRIADAAVFEASGKAMRLQADLDRTAASLDQERLARAAVDGQLEQALQQVGELQEQVRQQREQLQQAQTVFSADLKLAREAATAAETSAKAAVSTAELRADAATRRALLEVDQARQALAKAERQRDALQVESATEAERARAAQVEHARAAAQLQERLDAALARELALGHREEAVRHELAAAHQRLAQERQDAGALRAEAQTLRDVVAQLSAPIRASQDGTFATSTSPKTPRGARRGAAK